MKIFYLGLALLFSGEISASISRGMAQLQETQQNVMTTIADATTTEDSSPLSAVSGYFRRKRWNTNWSNNNYYQTATPQPTDEPDATVEPEETASSATYNPTATPRPTATAAATTTPQATTFSSNGKMMWGAELGDWQPSAIAAFEKTVGKPMGIYATFVHWGNEKEFPMLYTETVRDAGKTMLIFWEAKDYNVASINQTQFNYDSILNGNWDTYFTEFAADAKKYGGPVIMAPFNEMNDNSGPWGGQVNGNTPAKMIQGFRYVRKFFANTPNVKFAWAPNNVSSPQTAENDLDAYYPGDAYVDYVAVDGFNFGNPWQTWDQVFGKALTQLSRHNKPMLIASTASASGPNKASWISEGFGNQIKKYPLVQGWVWFNENKEQNWLINSDAAALAAFKSVLP